MLVMTSTPCFVDPQNAVDLNSLKQTVKALEVRVSDLEAENQMLKVKAAHTADDESETDVSRPLNHEGLIANLRKRIGKFQGSGQLCIAWALLTLCMLGLCAD